MRSEDDRSFVRRGVMVKFRGRNPGEGESCYDLVRPSLYKPEDVRVDAYAKDARASRMESKHARRASMESKYARRASKPSIRISFVYITAAIPQQIGTLCSTHVMTLP